MQDTNRKIPTLQELREKVEEENIEFGDNYVLDTKLVTLCLELVSGIDDFYDFLIQKEFDNYELPTAVFAQIKYYIEENQQKGNIGSIKKMLDYVSKLEQRGDADISNIIFIGFLENYDSWELENIWKYIPDNLREIILKWHPGYKNHKGNIYY